MPHMSMSMCSRVTYSAVKTPTAKKKKNDLCLSGNCPEAVALLHLLTFRCAEWQRSSFLDSNLLKISVLTLKARLDISDKVLFNVYM